MEWFFLGKKISHFGKTVTREKAALHSEQPGSILFFQAASSGVSRNPQAPQVWCLLRSGFDRSPPERGESVQAKFIVVWLLPLAGLSSRVRCQASTPDEWELQL
jgi:hypothetical protein